MLPTVTTTHAPRLVIEAATPPSAYCQGVCDVVDRVSDIEKIIDDDMPKGIAVREGLRVFFDARGDARVKLAEIGWLHWRG